MQNQHNISGKVLATPHSSFFAGGRILQARKLYVVAVVGAFDLERPDATVTAAICRELFGCRSN